MADLNYDISVSTKEAIGAINGLKNALGGLAAAFAIKELVQFSDGITNLRNKLISITPDVDAVNKQFNALAAIAISSRTPLEAIGSLFASIQRSAKALGISQQEAAQITDSLAKAMTASGMSAKEMQGPLLQLGQAMQSGVFQGDELRSILEGFPQVAQALADQLGVPVGALKKLGSEGQISADVFVKAMRKAKDSIDDAFGRTTPTISSALGTLKTVAQVAFNEFENNTQTGKNLATVIENLAFTFWQLTRRVDEFAGTIVSIAKIGALILTFTVLGAIIRSIVATLALFSNAFIWLIGTIKNFATVADKVVAWANTFTPALASLVAALISVGAAVLGSGIHKLFQWFKDAYDSASNFIDKIFSLGDASKKSENDIKTFREELEKQKAALDDSASASENAAYLAEELAKKLGLVRLEMQAQVNGVDRSLKQTQERLALENEFLIANKDRINISADEIAIGKMVNDIDIERRNVIAQLNDLLAKASQEYANMRVKDSEAGKEARGRIAILQDQINLTEDIYVKHSVGMVNLTRSNQNLKLLEEDRNKTQANIIKGIEDQIERTQKLGDIIRGAAQQQAEIRDRPASAQLVGLNSIQKQILDIQESSRKAALEAQRSFAAGFEDNGEGLTPERAQELKDGLNAITESYKNLSAEQVRFAKDQYDVSRQFDTGWKEAFASYAENANNAASQAKTYFDSFTKGFEDAFVALVTNGKWSFKDFANSIIADFARIEARKMMTNMMGGGGGGGIVGNIITWGKGLLGLAGGGPVSDNTPYIVGEKGPELFVPRTAGKIIPNNQLGGSMAPQPVTVNYNIQAVDASSFRALVARDPSFIYAVTEQGRRSQPSRRLA